MPTVPSAKYWFDDVYKGLSNIQPKKEHGDGVLMSLSM